MYRIAWRGFIAAIAAASLAACADEAAVSEAGAQAGLESAAQAAEAAQAGPPPIEQELPVIGPQRRILAFGDSLFAGYNLAEGEGYPERLQNVMRARGINAHIIDAGVSGDTTSEGLARIGFVLDNEEVAPELAIVELGGNDMLRGITPDATRENMAGILSILAERDIPVLLMGMRAPPNMGAEFQKAFDGLYGDLAADYNAALVPFFLEPVYDKPALIQADRIHPTAEGISLMVAANLDAVMAALPPAPN